MLRILVASSWKTYSLPIISDWQQTCGTKMLKSIFSAKMTIILTQEHRLTALTAAHTQEHRLPLAALSSCLPRVQRHP